MMKLRRLLIFVIPALLMLGFAGPVFSTHQRAAEITYRHLSGLTWEFTLVSYTYTPSPANAYRDFLPIQWGDGTASEIPRVEVVYLPDSVTFNRYIGQHTFPGPANYVISCEDPNRNGGINNIPNSINTPLYIYSTLNINPFLGSANNSPTLLIPPVDNGCVNQPFYHNPGAFDPDGDSLSYRLVPCRGAQGLVIPGYSYPAASTGLTLDPVTGDLLWDSPMLQGEYNIAILIEEWRRGQRIGSVLRDMQIIVVACQNRPPVIEPIADTCVEAGKTVRFVVNSYDPDSNMITLSGTGGPLVLSSSPATLDPNPALGLGHVSAIFRWSTECGHVARNPYQVFFKAKDNAKPVSLVTIQSMKILVVGPAPENLTATPSGNSVQLSWDNYSCPNATGYRIFRKADSTGYKPGYCQTGVPPYLGYSFIGQVDDLAQTSFLDDNNGAGLARGLKYCYMVVAVYPDKAESYASNEVCAALKKDVAVITNVSVETTDPNNGTIYTAWSMPTEIDPQQAPGPYRYVVLRSRSDEPGNFVKIDSLDNLADTIRYDHNLNTSAFSYTYRIDLYNITPGLRFLIGSSQAASSIYLKLEPHDKRMVLRWTNSVPWNNYSFVVYRKAPGATGFDSLATTSVAFYHDRGLINGQTYCYRIKSIGRFPVPGFIDPVINFSQEACRVVQDVDPPCTPALTVTTLCEEATNKLAWRMPSDTCPGDVMKYYIYYSPSTTGLTLIDSVLNPLDSVYWHKPPESFVGCYSMVAVDSVGNRSDSSERVCVDLIECEDYLYALPNVFTPNSDEWNELFRPKKLLGVKEIAIEIYDRWGRMVYKSADPMVNWDGRDMTTGQPCSDGVYFYVCDVFEQSLAGKVKRTLHGSLTLLR